VRIGILGGTFNPPHVGHLICAQEAYVQLELDRVMLIPARIPPHKPVDDEPGIEHRLALCQAAVLGDERLEVSDVEAVRAGPSYTVDTLAELHEQGGHDELFLVVGSDIAAGLPGWHEPARVLSLATLAVASRPGTSRAAVSRAVHAVAGSDAVVFFEMPAIGVSSTMVRRRVAAGTPIKYLVPEEVTAYIEHHGLYRGRADD
jgi:nicotinate-nucleotide adenylyltransferase